MKYLRAIFTGIGIFVLGLFVIGFIIGLTQPEDTYITQPTQQSKDTTIRNAFVSGCTEDGALTNSVCGCMYDKLIAMHPDLITNKALYNRIMTEGYNQAETDSIVTCVNTKSI